MAESRGTPDWLHLGRKWWQAVGRCKAHVQLESTGLGEGLVEELGREQKG